MRKKDFISKSTPAAPILNPNHLPLVREIWEKNGYDPDMYLNENDDFYNILEDFIPTKEQLKKDSFTYKYQCAAWQIQEDVYSFKSALNFTRYNFCGLYDVVEKRYVRPEEVPIFADYYLRCFYQGWISEFRDKFYAIFDSLAAHFIAMDVITYLESKSMYRVLPNEKNIDLFLRYGIHAGEIFDPDEVRYRKPKNFDEYAYYIHTDYWFHDPEKGYKPDSIYKWNPAIPRLLD